MTTPIILRPGQPVPPGGHVHELPDGSLMVQPPALEDSEAALESALTASSAPQPDDRALLQALAKAVSGIVEHLGLAPTTFEWDEEKHPRDEHGRFEGDGGGGPDSPMAEVAGTTITLEGTPEGTGTPQDPIYVGKDLDRAQQLLAEGKSIRLDDKKVASVLVARIGEYARELKARGERAPNFDLCRVSVADTNVFCAGNRGIPRAQMPQLRAPADEGTPAAAKRTDPANVNESVSVEAEFAQALRASGVAIEDKTVSGGMLRPTQSEINGAKTGSILQDMLAGKEMLGGKQIWTTKDGYVLDGHHRWAAGLAQSLLVGGDGGAVAVHEVQMEIGAAVDFARAFTKEQGLRQLDVSQFAILRLVMESGAHVVFDFDESKHPRDEKGRFGEGDGGDEAPKATVGHWREMSAEERIADQVDRLAPLVAKERWDLTPAEARVEAARLLEQGRGADPRGTAVAPQAAAVRTFVLDGVAADGTPVSSRLDIDTGVRISAARVEELQGAIRQLRETFPDRPVDYRVVSSRMANDITRGRADRVWGLSRSGQSPVLMTPLGVSPKGEEKYRDFFRQGKDSYQPEGAKVSALTYAAIHEFGHVIDARPSVGRSPESQRALDTIRPGSGYGRSKENEAFAESFAAWHLSGGTTTDALAQALGKSEGWPRAQTTAAGFVCDGALVMFDWDPETHPRDAKGGPTTQRQGT